MDRVKIECDFFIKSSPAMLFTFLTMPEGMCQWFADNVDVTGNKYFFEWEGFVEEAVCLEKEDDLRVRYRLADMEDKEYLEFKVGRAEISNDTVLYITDFADADDADDQRLYWKTQVEKLCSCIGGGN